MNEDTKNETNEEKKHERVYVICENMCRVEGMSKEQIEGKIKGQILSGKDIPSESLGEDGDIYIQYFD